MYFKALKVSRNMWRLDNLKSFQNVFDLVYIPYHPHGHLPRPLKPHKPCKIHATLKALQDPCQLHKPCKDCARKTNKMLDIP